MAHMRDMDLVNVQRTRDSLLKLSPLDDRPAALDVSNLFGATNIGGSTHWKLMGPFLVKSRHYSESQREDQW